MYLSNDYELTKSDEFNAVQIARTAAMYHLRNNESPTPNSQNYQVYQDIIDRRHICETWIGDTRRALDNFEIIELIKKLEIGHTLRLTSDIHDGAVYKKNSTEYIVSETELSGVITCFSIDQVTNVLNKWRDQCYKDGNLFFNQYLIV